MTYLTAGQGLWGSELAKNELGAVKNQIHTK